ncbi:hypothetical protein N7524_011869 [Penicillium chrysogenum]|nr:hypothetical protein N7524_011869 [Penicillium chrysogenum]
MQLPELLERPGVQAHVGSGDEHQGQSPSAHAAEVDESGRALDGRPKKLDEADREKLLHAIAENPKITREDMLAEVSHKVTYDSIRRLLNAENMRKWRCSWRPYLTEAPLKRLQWAMKYRHFTPKDWGPVYWSDEGSAERDIGVRREWTFIRPRDQPREKQC